MPTTPTFRHGSPLVCLRLTSLSSSYDGRPAKKFPARFALVGTNYTVAAITLSKPEVILVDIAAFWFIRTCSVPYQSYDFPARWRTCRSHRPSGSCQRTESQLARVAFLGPDAAPTLRP